MLLEKFMILRFLRRESESISGSFKGVVVKGNGSKLWKVTECGGIEPDNLLSANANN